MQDQIRQFITVDPGTCHGKPIFRGTRIPITIVLELLESGMSAEEILRGFPSLSLKAVRAAIHYAVQRIQDEEFIPLATGR